MPDQNSIVVTQTHFKTGADLLRPSENISVPYDLVKTVEHYLGSISILDYIDGFKTKGVPISRIAVAMCTHALMGNISEMGSFVQNLDENCIPHSVVEMNVDDYERFLSERRVLMSDLIRRYYQSL